LSGSCPIHPPQTKRTFLPFQGDFSLNKKLDPKTEGVTAAAAAAAEVFNRKDRRDIIFVLFFTKIVIKDLNDTRLQGIMDAGLQGIMDAGLQEYRITRDQDIFIGYICILVY
jgi:hypothetical protein